jgi:glycine/D-amino acid oxidase-like deaminating enzyme
MHSGVTLAPIVAELAVREILGGECSAMLAGCRP